MSIAKLKTKFFTGAFLVDVKHYFTKVNEIIDYLNGDGKHGDGSYKVYTVLLTQSGMDAPVATVLENTLGGTIVWSRYSTGIYRGTLANTFTLNKTFTSPPSILNSPSETIKVSRGDGNFIEVFVGVGDDILYNTSIEIKVYN